MTSVFVPLPTFIYRAPAFDWEQLARSLEDEASLTQLLDEDEIATAMKASAPEFWARYQEARASGVIPTKMIMTLRQYLIRMSTRSTPNRLFAGIGVGSLADATDVASELTKRVLDELAAAHAPLGLLGLHGCVRFEGRTIVTYADIEGKLVSSRYKVSAQLVRLLKSCTSPIKAATFKLRAKRALAMSTSQAEDLIVNLQREKILVSMGHPHSRTTSTGPHLLFQEELKLKKTEAERLLSVSEKLRQLAPVINRGDFIGRLRSFLQRNAAGTPFALLTFAPSFFDISSGTQLSGRSSSQEKYLMNALQAMSPRGGRWVLSPKDLEALSQASPAPAALTALAHISVDENGTCHYTLAGAVSSSAARILGRFGSISSTAQDLILKINQAEAELEPSFIHAAIAFDFQNPVVGGLAKNVNGFQYFVDFQSTYDDSKMRIALSDLAFVIVNERVALISLSLKREVKVHFTHTCNPMLEKHYYYRLLAAFEHARTQHAEWNWGIAEEMAASLPRVVLDGVIVKRARWILQRTDATKEQLFEDIVARGMPRQFMLIQGDQRMYIDLALSFGLDLLHTHYRSAPKLICEEIVGPIAREREIVVCGTRLKKVDQSGSSYDPESAKGLGDYTYFKLYAHPDHFDDIITHLAGRLKITTGGLHWFVVRYADPQPHLRFRMLRGQKSYQVRIELMGTIEELIAEQTVWRVEQQIYERELDRYGGAAGVRLYEKLANIDSHNLALFLRNQRAKFIRSDARNLGLALELIDFWLCEFLPDRKTRINLLKGVAHGKSRPGLRPDGMLSLKQSVEPRLRKALKEFHKLCLTWGPETQTRFVASFLHMSLNRWGIDTTVEASAYKVALKKICQADSIT